MASHLEQPVSEARPTENQVIETQALAEDVTENEVQELEADDDTDSAYGTTVASETTTVAEIYKGYLENGRRYQNVREESYPVPTDEKQWESMSAAHILFLILDSQRPNPLFRSPISSNAQHIIDIGTGQGDWALDVADKFPQVTVHAVDLFPPPQPFTAPNCIFEVDDLGKPWTWNHKFEFAHMRHLIGSFSEKEWNNLYQRVYDNLEPGGWIEHIEFDGHIECDDGTLPTDSHLTAQWGDLLNACGDRADRPLDTFHKMNSQIEAAGFINVQEQVYKCPLGNWPKLPIYKDAGRVHKEHFLKGMEGWVMYLLTKFGEPEPWAPEKVQVYLAKVREEVAAGYHIYQKAKRVWAQKPYE